MWVTCLVFFQAVLLLGVSVRAYWMARGGSLRVHGILLVGAVAVAGGAAAAGDTAGADGG